MGIGNYEMDVNRTLTGAVQPIIVLRILVLLLVCLTGQVSAQTSVARDIEIPVQEAIDTRQTSQAAQEKWDEEKTRLVALYDRLKAENEQLTAGRAKLAASVARQEAANRTLEAEKAEAARIESQMLPHLSSVLERMKALVDGDAPFLTCERTTRIQKLSVILEDSEITVAEKFRKTMEALFIEAEYGNTVEVYQEKISLDSSEVLGNIFRLGRVSLFFLSLDRETAAVFDVASGQWAALGHESIRAIADVTAMAAKHRPMEVISLPVGRLAPVTGGGHVQD